MCYPVKGLGFFTAHQRRNDKENHSMSMAVEEKKPVENAIVSSVVIIISGSINEHCSIDDETRKKCSLVVTEYENHARPVNHYRAGGGFARRIEQCAVSVIVYSQSREENIRKNTVSKTRDHLISRYGLPGKCIISFLGRDYRGICTALTARKFNGNILVVGKKPLLGWDRLARVCKENNLRPPKYIGP